MPSSPTKPATKEIYPARTFDQLVGDGSGRTLDKTILDSVGIEYDAEKAKKVNSVFLY